MFSLKRSAVAVTLTGLSVALMAGCKTSQPEAAKPVAPPVAQTNPQPAAPVKPLPDSGDSMAPNILTWDSVSKDYHAKSGEMSAPFSFLLKNVSANPVVIYDTSTSCDCTVAHLPASPWTIPGGGNGKIEATIDLSNKAGIVTNSIIIYTSKGNRRLYVKAFVADHK